MSEWYASEEIGYLVAFIILRTGISIRLGGGALCTFLIIMGLGCFYVGMWIYGIAFIAAVILLAHADWDLDY